MKINELVGYKQNPDYKELIKNPDFQSFAKKDGHWLANMKSGKKK